MAERKQCEFFLLRYVPDAVKDEFVNIGLLLLESQTNGAGSGYAGVRFTRDWQRVRCLDPQADIELLEALENEIRGQLEASGMRETLLERLQDSLSNTIQLSPAKACLAEEPQQEMETLARLYLERARRGGKRAATGRQRILGRMRDAFEQAGVWELMRKAIPVAQYTQSGDPLKIDCGYRPNGVIKLFHAVPLAADTDAAKVLAFSYPQIAAGIARVEQARAELTAVVEEELDRRDEEIAFALAVLEQSKIAVAGAGEMPRLAEMARQELRA